MLHPLFGMQKVFQLIDNWNTTLQELQLSSYAMVWHKDLYMTYSNTFTILYVNFPQGGRNVSIKMKMLSVW